MITLVGIFGFAVGMLCLSVRALGEPDTRLNIERSWPPWPRKAQNGAPEHDREGS